MSKAIVVLSGGQDSTTCLHWAIDRYGVEHVRAVAFDYGQKHSIELGCARHIADMNNVPCEFIDIKGMLQSTSPLTSDTPLDKYDSFEQMEAEVGTKIEKTFVPMRNSVFLTVVFNRAVVHGATHVVTGVCGEDNANYPDCTAEFIRSLQVALNESLGRTASGDYITIETPLMYLSKADTVHLAATLPGCLKSLAYSHTSYDGKYPPTDPNHSNILRAHGFEEADTPDPLVVRAVCEGVMEVPTTHNYRASKFLMMQLAIGVTDMRAAPPPAPKATGPKAYTVLHTRTLGETTYVNKGDTVYAARCADYGLANDDTRLTGMQHISVTLDPTGDYPYFTIPVAHLRNIEG